ncbi:hypothetical protein OS493_009988 [Desmophyllum pertusum]|uniref:Uncharacterized protein n=1 Tax=Desmophyllum pertusum TaxID=174260 RepID=A0A9W9YE92_9CNID|nr:hypothetical protein OS493_009988 [Desmophyllum pertusum]
MVSWRNLYTKSADGVELTKVTFTEEAKQVLVNATLCLVVKQNDSIEDMFINKVKSGKLSEDFTIKSKRQCYI